MSGQFEAGLELAPDLSAKQAVERDFESFKVEVAKWFPFPEFKIETK